MKSLVIAIALAISGCTTTTSHLAASPPLKTVHSAKSREAVTDCLLNRVASDDVLPSRQVGPSETTLAFNGRGMVRQPALYLFVIHDEGTGSAIDVRRYANSSLAAAETCFS